MEVSDQTEDVERSQRRRVKFPGLQLTATDREGLRVARGGGRRLSERRWRRIRILELLDQGWKLSQTAIAVGTYPREVRRVGWRYLERGLAAALSDDPRRRDGLQREDRLLVPANAYAGNEARRTVS